MYLKTIEDSEKTFKYMSDLQKGKFFNNLANYERILFIQKEKNITYYIYIKYIYIKTYPLYVYIHIAQIFRAIINLCKKINFFHSIN